MTLLLFGNAWDRWRQYALKFICDGPVLDLGCGTGVLVHTLASAGTTVYGLDRASSMLRQSAKRPGCRNRLLQADATQLPFSSASFEACVATFPANFILRRETLDEVARVLLPGGAFVVVFSGETRDWDWWRQPIRLLLRAFYGRHSREVTPDGSVMSHEYLVGEWHTIHDDEDSVLLWVAERVEA